MFGKYSRWISIHSNQNVLDNVSRIPPHDFKPKMKKISYVLENQKNKKKFFLRKEIKNIINF